jgi:hypothetical protein
MVKIDFFVLARKKGRKEGRREVEVLGGWAFLLIGSLSAYNNLNGPILDREG